VRDGQPWYFTGSDMKWFINWLGVRGVNLFIPHAFYYSVEGKRKDERPPDVGPNNIWWKYFKQYADYMRRISYIMTDSVNNARIAVLCESGNMAAKQLRPLYENQIEFNYLARSFLEAHPIVNGKIEINGYIYEHILDASSTTLDDDVANIIATRDAMFVTPHPDLRVTHITKNGVEMYFFSNEGFGEIQTDIMLPANAPLIAVDLWRGHAYKIQPHLHLAVGETLLIIVDADGKSNAPKRPDFTDLGDLTSQFRLIDHDTKKHIKTYATEITINEVARNEIIQIRGEEMAECFVNGKFAGVSFANPHHFEIGSLIKNGANKIEVLFTGSAANRYGNGGIAYGII